MSESHSEFDQTWRITIFAKKVNAFEYNGVFLTEVIELKFKKSLKLVKHIADNVFTFFVILVVTCVTFFRV